MTPNYPACYGIIIREDKILFVLRENTSYMNGFYSLPAGRVEEGETFSNGCVREIEEEVGLRLSKEHITYALTLHRKTNTDKKYWVDVFFKVSQFKGDPYNASPNEHSKIEWLPLNNLPDNIMDWQKAAINAFLDGKQYLEFGW